MQRPLATLLVVLGVASFAAAQRTVWSGVYTSAQAARGQVAYERSCKRCHSEDLSGGIEAGESVPALRRDAALKSIAIVRNP